MLKDRYRQEMEQINLDEEAMGKILYAMTAKQSSAAPIRRKLRIFLIAAVLCVAVTISAVAFSPELRYMLFHAMGSFAPYSQRVSEGSVEDQEFEISVLSAVTDQYRLRLYVQVRDLTEKRLTDENIELWCKIQRETGESIARNRCVSFDPDTHTALFEITDYQEEPSGLQENMRLEVGYVWPQVYHFETTQPLPKELIPTHTLDCITLEDGQVVLRPNQTPAPLSGFDKAELSSMGFASDGSFQILFRLSGGALLKSAGNHTSDILATVLVDGQSPCDVCGSISFELDGTAYVGISCTNIDPKDMEKLTISKASGTVIMGEQIFGEWDIPFQVENYPVMEMNLTGEAKGKHIPTQLILTPLGAMVRGEQELGYHGYGHFAVLCSDGTRLEDVQIRPGRMTPSGMCILGNWDFMEPLDLECAVALELDQWYIPLVGNDAGKAYPIR